MENGLANLKQLIDVHNERWGKSPEEATIVECRAFAEKHGLELPTGVSRSKEAFVAMFTCCRLSNGWEGKKSFRENFPKITADGHEKELFAYRNRLDAADDVSKNRSHLRVVSSSTASELAEYDKKRRRKSKNSLRFPINPKTGEQFKSKQEWHKHNIASQKSFDLDKMKKKLTGSKPVSKKKPSAPKTWPKRFGSVKEWHDHNQRIVKKSAAEEKAKTESKSKPVGFSEELDAALIAANS